MVDRSGGHVKRLGGHYPVPPEATHLVTIASWSPAGGRSSRTYFSTQSRNGREEEVPPASITSRSDYELVLLDRLIMRSGKRPQSYLYPVDAVLTDPDHPVVCSARPLSTENVVSPRAFTFSFGAGFVCGLAEHGPYPHEDVQQHGCDRHQYHLSHSGDASDSRQAVGGGGVAFRG
jgi:hypothetical protein